MWRGLFCFMDELAEAAVRYAKEEKELNNEHFCLLRLDRQLKELLS